MRRPARSTVRHVGALGAVVLLVAGCRDVPTAPRTDAAAPARHEGAAALAELPPAIPFVIGEASGARGFAFQVNDAGNVLVQLESGFGQGVGRWLVRPTGEALTIPYVEPIVGFDDLDRLAGGYGGYPCRGVIAGLDGHYWQVPYLGPAYPASALCVRPVTASRGGVVILVGNAYPPFLPPGGEVVVRATEGSWSMFGTIPAGLSSLTPAATSSDAEYIAGQLRDATGQWRAFSWRRDAASPTLLGGVGAQALGVNASGVVVGTQGGRPVRFDGSSAIDLMPGVSAAREARAISDAFAILVNGSAESWLLRGGAAIPLGGLGGCCVRGLALNERSQVAGYAVTPANVQRPVTWDAATAPLTVTTTGPWAGREGTPIAMSATTGGGTPPVAVTWALGDGSTATGATISHSYVDDGRYVVTVTARDATGATATATTEATPVNAAPTVQVRALEPVYSGVPFTVRARFDDPGVLDAPWRWEVLDADARLATGEGTIVPDSIAEPLRIRAAGAHLLAVRVTDADGGAGTAYAGVEVLRLPVPMGVAPATPQAARQGAGLLTVTLIGTDRVRAADVDPATVRLLASEGDPGLAPALRGDGRPMAALEDVNGDGVPELVLKFRRNALAWGDAAPASLVLLADLRDGRQIEGRAGAVATRR